MYQVVKEMIDKMGYAVSSFAKAQALALEIILSYIKKNITAIHLMNHFFTYFTGETCSSHKENT